MYFRCCGIHGSIYICCTFGVVDKGVVIASVFSKSGFVNVFLSLRIFIAAVQGQVLFFTQARAADYIASSVLSRMAQTQMYLECERFYGCSCVFYFIIRRLLRAHSMHFVGSCTAYVFSCFVLAGDDGIVLYVSFLLLLHSGLDILLLFGLLAKTEYPVSNLWSSTAQTSILCPESKCR